MSIPSLLLIALVGGPDQPAPEAAVPYVPLMHENSAKALFSSPAWQLDLEERMGSGAGLYRAPESVELPIPQALWVGSALHGHFEQDYRAGDLARDLLLDWAVSQELEDGLTMFGMTVTLLTDFSQGTYGVAFSRSF